MLVVLLRWDKKMTSVVVYLEAQMMIDCCQLATVLDNELMMKKTRLLCHEPESVV